MKTQANLFKSMIRNKGKWVDPFNAGFTWESFSILFYAGLCERRLNPDNHWSYQYRIAK